VTGSAMKMQNHKTAVSAFYFDLHSRLSDTVGNGAEQPNPAFGLAYGSTLIGPVVGNVFGSGFKASYPYLHLLMGR
jgi:hypothetical protein